MYNQQTYNHNQQVNSNLERIASDHEMAIANLNAEELKLGLECARRVRSQLKKQIYKKTGNGYFYNLVILETIIRSYENSLKDYPELPPSVQVHREVAGRRIVRKSGFYGKNAKESALENGLP